MDKTIHGSSTYLVNKIAHIRKRSRLSQGKVRARVPFTKIATLMTVLDDLYDTHGKLEQLKIFTQGVKRWDFSLIEGLPGYMKTAFEFFFRTSNELIAEVEKGQGRDMAAYIQKNAEFNLEFLRHDSVPLPCNPYPGCRFLSQADVATWSRLSISYLQ